MNKRSAHFVGSIPFKDEKTAMAKAVRYLGRHLLSLPDGEIGKKSDRHRMGERLGWIQWVIERFEDNPAFTMVKKPSYDRRNGLWADYDSGVRYSLNVRPQDLHRHLDFGYVGYFNSSYAIFKSLRKKYRLKNLSFQFGIPGALAISLFSLGPVQGLRTRKIFEDRRATEANRIHEIAGDDVLFQIEVPIELGLSIKAPRFLRPLVTRVAVGYIISLVNKLHGKARVGIHLCLGDLNNRPFSRIRDVGPLVSFSNEIVRQWPEGRPLEFIHYPLAMGNIPPVADPEFYAPLRRLNLPAETRFIAGFVHEKLSDKTHREILALIEGILGRSADISSSCGLGRRTAEITERMLKKTAKLLA
ncbi:MAG: hypothetical protein A2176_06960 [Spirochaetes bacterium RBG_13_51_14]|nr:MAG: hypothetical protein A2176_06960 [Spirochaetes bacterium RBG_13_51_14]